MEKNPRFTETDDGWWRDSVTGLEWSPTAPTRMTHDRAVAWCKSIGGRLPTVGELIEIVNYGRHSPATDMLDTRSDSYWSASTYAPSPFLAWYVLFLVGYVFADFKTSNFYVRAVRSGS